MLLVGGEREPLLIDGDGRLPQATAMEKRFAGARERLGGTALARDEQRGPQGQFEWRQAVLVGS